MPLLSAKELAQRTEFVLVRPDATRKEIQTLCQHALENNFRAICVNSSRVAEAFVLLEDSEVKVISTLGFPIGASDSDVKRYEAEVAIDNGAQEFELVLNLGHLKDREEANLLREVRDIVDAAEERPVSILLGAKLLSCDEQILVCNLAVEAGAKFLNAGNADIETIKFLRETLGKKFGIKVSGEISDAQTASTLIEIGATNFSLPFIPSA
ncbi:MAG: deoxyribose-phosphate aldolase [Verrucomicrobiota bacterium]